MDPSLNNLLSYKGLLLFEQIGITSDWQSSDVESMRPVGWPGDTEVRSDILRTLCAFSCWFRNSGCFCNYLSGATILLLKAGLISRGCVVRGELTEALSSCYQNLARERWLQRLVSQTPSIFLNGCLEIDGLNELLNATRLDRNRIGLVPPQFVTSAKGQQCTSTSKSLNLALANSHLKS